MGCCSGMRSSFMFLRGVGFSGRKESACPVASYLEKQGMEDVQAGIAIAGVAPVRSAARLAVVGFRGCSRLSAGGGLYYSQWLAHRLPQKPRQIRPPGVPRLGSFTWPWRGSEVGGYPLLTGHASAQQRPSWWVPVGILSAARCPPHQTWGSRCCCGLLLTRQK